MEKKDNINYIPDKDHCISSVTTIISKEQYEKLDECPDLTAGKQIPLFDPDYNFAWNNCINFAAHRACLQKAEW